METTNNEIMTVREVAEYLRLVEATIYKTGAGGRDPGAEGGAAMEV